MSWQSSLGKVVQRPARTPELRLSEDDFSRQIKILGDPLFWWRMERLGETRVTFTDFNAGQQSDATMADCLGLLLNSLDLPPKVELTFADLVPQKGDPTHQRIALNATVHRLESWIAGACAELDLPASEPTLAQQEGKKFAMKVQVG